MKKIILSGLFLCAFFFADAQCVVTDYSNYRKVLKMDGDYVLLYDQYKRVYRFDGEYICDMNYKRLAKMDGEYIVRYSDYKRIARWDGEYLIDYSNYKKIARLECPGRRSALAAAVYFLF
jgi:hypothetical protein